MLWGVLVALLALLAWLGIINGSMREQIASLDVVDQAKNYVAETTKKFVAERATNYLRDGNSDQST